MIFVAEIPKTKTNISYERIEHGGSALVWAANDEVEFIQTAGDRTQNNKDVYTSFDDALDALNSDVDIERVLIFSTANELREALAREELYPHLKGEVYDEFECIFLTEEEIHINAKIMLKLLLDAIENPSYLVADDGEIFFG